MPQHTLTNAQVGDFYRRCNGILERLDQRGLAIGKTHELLQLVAEGQIAIYNGIGIPDHFVPSSIVRVARSESIIYPPFARRLDRGDLEFFGPTKYDLLQLKHWELDELRTTENGLRIYAEVPYRALEDTKLLRYCQDLRDLEAIREKGYGFYFRYLYGKVLMGWKSAIWTEQNDLLAPCLYEKEEKVVLEWMTLKHGSIGLNSLTLLFP